VSTTTSDCLMYDFCTYFDQYYLPRGLALYRSLRQHCPSFRLWVLCMDAGCHRTLTSLRLPEVRAIALEEFEKADAELLNAKKNRSRIEYYFTCTPSLPLYVLNANPDVDCITYLDADLYFYADPKPIFEEMKDRSIAIIEHRFAPNLRELERCGIYNVGWLTFRRDERALTCLRWWRDRCIEWCYDREEDGKFGDQKYLDDWPTRFPGVSVIQHKGANLALWNLANYAIHSRGGSVWVDDQQLIVFHFHGLKQIGPRSYQLHQAHYHLRIDSTVRNKIYRPYVSALREEGDRCRNRISPTASPRTGISRTSKSGSSRDWGIRWLRVVRSILIRDYLFVVGDRVI